MGGARVKRHVEVIEGSSLRSAKLRILKILYGSVLSSLVFQASLPLIKIDPEKKKGLDGKLKEIYDNIRNRFENFGKFQDVLVLSSNYSSVDLKDKQTPEEFAKRNVMEPLFEFLGFETVSETSLPSPSGRNEPDYVIRPKGQDKPIFYVEAEPLNADLYARNVGVSQVNSWLLSRASKTDYGIATNGFEWILLKFDSASAQSREVLKVNLRVVFLRMLNPKGFFDLNEIEKVKESFLVLHSEYVSSFLESYLARVEEAKEEISKRFYNDYVKYVFGHDKEGKPVSGVSLLNKIIAPSGTSGNEQNLFPVVFMNRLIFIKFLEEKKIVPENLLENLLGKYKVSGAPSTFYETYLKPLFYEVFNKSKSSRASAVRSNPVYDQIPYLNGGLFREVIRDEKNYNIENEGVELVIENLLERYHFGLDSGADINPEILGYIFEKTINFISGTGTNQQKMQGAYYTPDDVVEFIIEQTLIPVIFKKMIEGLKNAGWSDTDLKGYNSIEEILKPENIPKNPIHVRKMLESLGTIKILDPACGSGHFLTAMLSEILRVQEYLLKIVGDDIDRCKLKRDIISSNIFGVDIDENAVEIARLRLWLSIIEEVEDVSHIDTLPNIDFNILVGNSLVGWLDEGLSMHPLTNLLDDDYVQGALDTLSAFYGITIDEVRESLGKMRLEDTIKAYRALLGVYTSESGERAVKIRGVLEKIRERLYEVINGSYLAFVRDKSNLALDKMKEIEKEFPGRRPLHWRIDFESIFGEGGFDVVVGNPPYIENGNYSKADLTFIKRLKTIKNEKEKKKEEPLFYYSKDCGNTHAYFIERSIKLLKQGGRFGFIVPIALVSTDRMDSIREFIHKNSLEAGYYNFDDRPGKIFSGLEHCRSTIVITGKGTGVSKVTTSKYHRWYSENRPQLFKNLKTTDWSLSDPREIVPKIGTETEKTILNKLKRKSNGKTVKDFVKEEGVKIWYHNAPQYWIHAHTDDYLPKVEYYEGYKQDEKTGEIIPQHLKETKTSAQYKDLILNRDYSVVVNGLLNSSLFYWWYVVWSDGRHLLDEHIKSFPIDIDSLPDDLKEKLKSLTEELMKRYDKNSNIKINRRSGGYTIKIKEIIPSKSRSIIDQIDEILADYFELNTDERNFIKDFDINIRIKEEVAEKLENFVSPT